MISGVKIFNPPSINFKKMNIVQFLKDEQDPKTVEKVISKLKDLLIFGEELIYLAVQKKPAINLTPNSIVISNKRIFYCQPSNWGLTMNFKDIAWKNIKEVSFKEEFFTSKFICVPQQGQSIVTGFIPKLQTRKLYQAATQQLEAYKELLRQQLLEENKAPNRLFNNTSNPQAGQTLEDVPAISQTKLQTDEIEDETTAKLRKLKNLFDKQLINKDEYESKKAAILNNL